jgi:hypothetical protein
MGYLWMASAALLVMQQAAVTQPGPRSDYLKVMDGQFRQLDADGDGKVMPQEVVAKEARDQRAQALALNRKIFGDLDKDRNGSLSADEFGGLVGTPPSADPRPFMQRMDLDKDGTVTLVEHRTVLLATFDAIDSDKDGVVTPAEMQASEQREAKAQPTPPAKR